MKIVAIRGANLASLAGPFELRLDAPPFYGSGVFAICGPTGAGKSTLLDAMCLALFDRTPRLVGRSQVKVGDDPAQQIGEYDVRGILRRGCAEGYAEVDFDSDDGLRYRARWQVRRARNRADGQLQNQELSLVRLPQGTPLGGTKSETLQAIAQRLGLSFDQFRRSVLLAQGEFAAFLRADGKDRSELLERITGTGIYTQLSRLAHVRYSEIQKSVAEQTAIAANVGVLSAEARARLQAEHQCLVAASTELQNQFTIHQAYQAWRLQWEQAHAAVTEALQHEQQAQATLTALASVQADLNRLEQLHAVRGPWRQRTLAQQRIAELTRTQTQATQDLATSQAAHDRLATVHAELLAHQESLTTAIAAHGGLRADLASGVAPATAPSEPAFTLGHASAMRQQFDVAVPRVCAQLQRVAADAHQLQQADTLSEKLLRLAQATQQCFEITEDRTRLNTEVTRLQAQLAQHRPARQRAEAELAAAEKHAKTFTRRKTTSLDAYKLAEARARHVVQQWENLGTLLHQWHLANEAQSALTEATAQQQVALAQLRTELSHAERTRAQCVAVNEEAERALQQLQRRAGYAHQRSTLRPGEPCPLCGAAEHPWADQEFADAAITEQTERVATTQAAVRAQDERLLTLRSHIVRVEEQLRNAALQQAQYEQTQHAQRAQWQTALREVGLLLYPDLAAANAVAWRAEQAAIAHQQLASAAAERERSEKLALNLIEANASIKQHSHTVAELTRTISEFETALARTTAQMQGLFEQLTSLTETTHELRTSLASEIREASAWAPSQWTDPTALRRAAQHLGTAAQAYHDTRTEAQSLLQRTQAVQQQAQAQLADLAQHRAAAQALQQSTAQALQVAQHEHAEAQALVASALSAVSLDEGAAAHLLALSEAEVGTMRQQLAHAQTAATQARARTVERQQRATELAASEPTRPQALRRDAAEALAQFFGEARPASAPLRLTLFVLDGARAYPSARNAGSSEAPGTSATGTADDLVPHASPAPAPSGELSDAVLTFGAALQQLRAAVQAQTEQRHGALVAHTQAEARRAELVASADAALAAAKPLAQLAEAIGSHDGKAFRIFAQSLSLDALLMQANAHLQALAPRYALMRIANYDLELQIIDRDMGDDVRSLASLSGGETFLLSLALALGLSSLASHSVRVQSLFVDEGFGTLDAQSLETALAMLDSLQASGRQVGIISHVGGIAERTAATVFVQRQSAGRSRVRVHPAPSDVAQVEPLDEP